MAPRTVRNLILPICSSREGSSLVTSMFAAHGCWTGNLDGNNQFGYMDWENVDVKRYIQHNYPNPTHIHYEPTDSAGFRNKMLSIVGDREWAIIKTFNTLFDVWHDAFPDAKYCVVMRDTDDAVQSMFDKGHRDWQEVYNRCVERHERMQAISDEYGYPIIRTTEVMKGDYSTLQKSFDYCGLEFDPRIATDCIDPEKWHYG